MKRTENFFMLVFILYVVLFSTVYSTSLRWMRNYEWEAGYLSREELHWGIVTSDGNYLGCGSVHYRESSQSFELLLIKVNTLGDELWHKFYDNDDRPKYAESVKETPDKGFILTGTKYINADTSGVCLIKTDSLGEMEWNQLIIGEGISTKCKGYAVELADDGGYIITGNIGGG